VLAERLERHRLPAERGKGGKTCCDGRFVVAGNAGDRQGQP